METTASLIVDTPNLTVSLEGSYTTVEATTAENTLIVAKNTVIETLTVKKGNVKIYGTVGEIVNEGTGKIIRCIDAQDEVERTLADTRCDHILIEKPAGTLDFGGRDDDQAGLRRSQRDDRQPDRIARKGAPRNGLRR